MVNSTELKECNSDFHRGEQEVLAPLTVQPKKQTDTNADAVAQAPKLGYKPAHVFCTKCNREVTTTLTFHISDFTHLSVFLCSVATWPCFACFLSGIPYCVTACHKVDHRCPQCKTLIGKHAQFRLSKIFGCKK